MYLAVSISVSLHTIVLQVSFSVSSHATGLQSHSVSSGHRHKFVPPVSPVSQLFFQSHSQSLHTHCPSSLTQSLRTQLSLRSQAPSLFKHSCLILSFTQSLSHTLTCQSFQSHSVSLHTHSLVKNKLYKPDRALDFSEIGSSSSRELSYSFYCDLRIRIHAYV